MRTARSSSHLRGGGLHTPPPPGPDTPPPPGTGTSLKQAPTPGPDTPPSPWTETLTHDTENISLPQTSFAGGN